MAVGEECNPEQILLDPLSTMKREMADGLVLEPARTLAIVPKVGGAQALGIAQKRPGGDHVGIAGLGSLMGFQGQVGFVSGDPGANHGGPGQAAQLADAMAHDDGRRSRSRPEALVHATEYGPTQAVSHPAASGASSKHDDWPLD